MLSKPDSSLAFSFVLVCLLHLAALNALYGSGGTSSAVQIKPELRLAVIQIEIGSSDFVAQASSSNSLPPTTQPSLLSSPSSIQAPLSERVASPKSDNLQQRPAMPNPDAPSQAARPADVGAIEQPSKFVSPDLLEQAARPVNDVWLDTSRLPIQQIYKVAIRVFVNSKGVVEQFRIIETDLPAASIDAVFALFAQTPFTPGMAAGQPQDSFVNLELDIDTFPQDRPRIPLSQPAAR